MRKRRILFVSDAAYPLGNTGFGIAGGALLKGLVECGLFDISHIGRGLKGAVKAPGIPIKLYCPPESDGNGYQYIGYVCEYEKPDLIVFEADPQSIDNWRKSVAVRRVPNLVHTPLEGAPLLEPWSDTLREIVVTGGWLTTYTQFAADEINRRVFSQRESLDSGVADSKYPRCEVLRLGLDHANFRPYSPEHRARLRESLGWTDRFVVMNVARNAERKGWPRLFEAVALLKNQYPQLSLYAHTVPFENYFLNGHNLMALAREYGITDRVNFLYELRDPMVGIAYEGEGQEGLSLIDMYNAADLFVAPTMGEGWNLPVCEAAACGVPVVTTQYGGGWEVAQDFAFPLCVYDYSTHPSGTRQANVRPSDITTAIELFLQHENVRLNHIEKGLAATSQMRWQPAVDRFVEIAKQITAPKVPGV